MKTLSFTLAFHRQGFGFSTGALEENEDGYKYGTTRYDNGVLYSTLNTSGVIPLLRSDLYDSERLQVEYSVAQTLVHEMIHAVAFIKALNIGEDPFGTEPYFDQQRKHIFLLPRNSD